MNEPFEIRFIPLVDASFNYYAGNDCEIYRNHKSNPMPILINGEKYYVKDLVGTDLEAVNKFLNKIKGKACLMVYVDANGKIKGCGIWKTKKALKQLEEHLNIKLDSK